MRLLLILLLFVFGYSKNSFSQFELSTGYAINRRLADGPPLQIGYDVKLKKGLFTKSQVGYKYLYHFNDFVGVRININIIEFHQTFSYEVIKKKKFILKPNLGVNYRFYNWKGEMISPYNSLPQRVYIIGFRDYKMRLNSFSPTVPADGKFSDSYSVNNLGFTIQIQSQFKLNNKLWLHITPFLEPDYDRIQNTGGVYIGVIFKNE
jgi:Outer membrane protein beta-barrel domain